ncbi:prenyl protease [Cordyceps militaris]|uniref:Prenyl protease n=1 Tax=Cordyceps militaris TaxID=73501 RepID=A0A2H4SID0_CORMI|nr:prenyl protease [Cordyceps militaris]
MTLVQGHCDPKFAKLRDLMHEFLASGQDIGCSLCVNLHGAPNVVDLWGGHADAAGTTPWTRSTIVAVFSATKLVTNLAAAMLLSRGLLRTDDPVVRHWPGFAAADVTVGQVLAHTAGLCTWADDVTLADICDAAGAAERLARQAPLWPPGTAMGYHGLTQGVLVAELVRRVTGLSIDRFIAQEVCAPLGSDADFQLGCRARDADRVAPVVVPPGPSIWELCSRLPGFHPHSLAARTICNPEPCASDANSALWRASVLPSANGHTNARALVKILSCYALGGVCAGGGHRLLSPETVELVLGEHARGVDLVLGTPGRRGLGVYLTGEGSGRQGKLPDGRVAWGSGWGGSFVVMDADRGMTMAYTMNRMVNGENPSAAAFVKAVYDALGVQLDVKAHDNQHMHEEQIFPKGTRKNQEKL